MKTLILFLALAAGAAFAAMPIEKTITHVSTPLQLGFDESHSLFPKEYGVHGLRLNCYFVNNRYMHGIDIGFWNASEAAGGLQLALYRAATYDFGGIQIAGWKTDTKDIGGFQYATMWNDAQNVDGVQLTGVFGKARSVDGAQLAVLSAVAESETGEEHVHGLQAGLWEARAENMNGIQLGGVFASAKHEANGLQMGMLFAETTDTRGLQLGGLTAQNKRTKGVQFGGLLARSELDADGLVQASLILAETGQMRGALQLAGVAANVIGESDGAQIGVVSTMSGSMNGLQASLIWNYVFEQANGLQFSALYNHAQSIHGVQIGLINHCSRLEGVQIGLINTVQEARYSTCPLLRIDF